MNIKADVLMIDDPHDFDTLWNYDDPAATEALFRALLPRAEQGDDRSYHAQLLTQIARAQGLQRKFIDAHATLDTAQALLAPELSAARIRYQLERGRVFNSSQQVEQARPLFQEAWEHAQAEQQDFYAIDAAHMLAIVAPAEQQLAWNLRALALAEQSPQPRARTWLGSLYNNIGWAYHKAGRYEQALDMFQKALHEREAAGRATQIRIARWCVARGQRSIGQFEAALATQRELLAELELAGEKDGYVFEELAENLLALKQPNAAQAYFALAYAELSQDAWLAENEPQRIEHLKVQGKVKS
jgi:tetratricopeptide (TPR) repeat protein